jgi:ATP-binding cassette subfamily B protein
VINLLITSIGRDLLTLIGLVAVMVVKDPLMSFFSFVVAPPAFLVLRKLIRRVYAIGRTQFQGGTRILETLQETLQGIRIVKAFTLEDTMRERFDRNVAAVEHEANKMARVSGRSSPLMETLGGCAIAIAITYSGYRVIETGATPGQFFSFIAAFLLAYEPAKRLARLNIELNSGLVGVRVLFEVIDSPPSEPSDASTPELRIETPRLVFDDVHFGYHRDEAVLRGISFVAEPGKLTALVGPSGSGKTTIINLILRFYDVERGMIAIDGQDVRSVSRRSLRRHLAYVGQDVFLFRGTVRENIAFGKPGASETEIVAAAKGAYAHDFIMSFPRGYDTPVGEHGLQLSGGQRQRVAIARALIKNAPFILLDEATAALDSESELAVREAMEHLCQGRTTVAIAHRLHTVSHADCIYVIEDGLMVEFGRHDELLRQSGRYAAFYRLQLKQQETPAPIAEVAK